MRVRDTVAGVEMLLSMCLTVLFGLDLVAYHYLCGRPTAVDAKENSYAPFFESIVEPVPGAVVDRCEGQSNTPAVVRKLRRSLSLAELEHLFGPSTIDRATRSWSSNITPDATVEVHKWDGGLRAEFYVRTPMSAWAWPGRGRIYTTSEAIGGLVAIEFGNERVGQSPDAWRKHCDAMMDFDVIAQGKSLSVDLAESEPPL
jgi:hypothetical protein